MTLDRRVVKLVVDRLTKEADLLLICSDEFVSIGRRNVRWRRIYRWVINCELILPAWEKKLMDYEVLLVKRFGSKTNPKTDKCLA